MSNTANFDFCVELGIAGVREIFHLAFKAEDRFPHNVGPLARTFGMHEATIYVRVLDDETDAADLAFTDEKHITFSFPFEIDVQIADAPDPALTHVVMRARVSVPGELTSWEEDGADVLGLSFHNLDGGDVTVESLTGLPSVDVDAIRNAIHARYETVPHSYTQGGSTLNIYDGNRDLTLDPPNKAGSPEITADIETHDGVDYLALVVPLHVSAPSFGYQSYGVVRFWRALERTGQTISIDFAAEPSSPEVVRTKVELDFHVEAAATQVRSAAISALAGFGTITEPAFDQASAEALLRQEVAGYLQPRRWPVYSPQAVGDVALSTPVGFLLVEPGVLAILLNRRGDGDHAPDDFLGGRPLAVAVGRARVDEEIALALREQFPGLDGGGHLVETEEGTATLTALSVVPENPSDHGEDRDHLWASGEAEVHIDCWPDPDVSFEGPLYLTGTPGEDEEGNCTFEVQASAGEFDIGQSCCDVFLDLIIPIVGWIMLAIIESTIDSVGGAVIEEIASGQERTIAAFPPVINGVAEVGSCLQGIEISAEGFVFPATLSIRRLDESFEDRQQDRDQPRP